ncbi:MAG TPA: gliding motility-associated C-terminal domain-containing protein [Puia sp.]|nr:gliding motility-associated C-terminal domain-containing protein [Puia sp.]
MLGMLLFAVTAYKSEGATLILTSNTVAGTCGNNNGSISIIASGGNGNYQYSIDGGVTWQPSNTFNNLAGGVYNFAVQDNATPPNTGTISVALGNIAGPQVLIQPIPATCANNDGELDLIITGGTPPFQISVDGVSYGTGNLVGGLGSGNRFVAVQDNNGCLVSQLTNIPLNNDLTLATGPGATVCRGTSSPLTLTTNATAFSWSPATSLDNPKAAQPNASPATTTTYTVLAALGVCVASGTETITVLPAPTPTATPGAATICYGQSVQLQGGGGVSYQWEPSTYLSGTTIPNPMVQAPQKSVTYSLTVTGVNGCKSVEPAVVLVVVTPPPVVFAGDDTAILVGQTLPLNAIDVNNSGFTSYQWLPVIGLDNPSIEDPVATITGDITYIVTATTAQGCSGTDSIHIKAVTMSDIVVANAFTPNGDGRNDVLRVHSIGIKDFKYFRVFNRWGQQVFYTTNEGAGWDGWTGGQVQPAGTYVWVAMGLDFSGRVVERRGTVILLR